MLDLRTLTELLGYDNSPHFRTKESEFEPESVHYFRHAKAKERQGERFAVKGFYVFETGGDESASQSARPAICVAEASSIEDAKKLHRRIWNLGNVPFLLVRLPDQVRIYCGFRYDEAELVLQETSQNKTRLQSALHDFTADSIDSARIWQAQRERLDTRHRVDTRLLANLGELAQALAKHCVPKLDDLATAHSLIGKFVYLRYLRDRNILDDKWLAEREIDLDNVFGPNATVAGLARLVEALEARFNGDIFHLDFGLLHDSQVQLVASVFAGDKIQANETGFIRQLHLKFQAYDFRHIPVETLSSIYEQFIHAQQKGRSDGAYYTPEILADYLLSEINSIRQLQPGMRILDASAGSGIFLVLAYRRLIELERRRSGRAKSIDPMRLRGILLESIYGVERQPDACNVAVFSLILTLLNYVAPPELHANEGFKFPDLLKKDARIFCDDFFNPALKLPTLKDGFDVVVGNPPWIELKPSSKGEDYAKEWMSKEKAVAGNRVADAFALKAGRLLSENGGAGLLLPASTLFNLEGEEFRQNFFTEFSVARITNLANLRNNLFGDRIKQPATTIVFQKGSEKRHDQPILHVAPFAANQATGEAGQLWALTIQGSDIQRVSQRDAAKGETSVWKLALWGTTRDARAIERIRQLCPLTLEGFCKERDWGEKLPRQGAELRNDDDKEAVNYCDELKGQKRFDTKKFNKLIKDGLHFSLPNGVLVSIPDKQCYVRERGGMSGLAVNRPPHLMISATWKNFLVYSEEYFAIPPRQMAIAALEKDKEQLRALAVYLGSSLVDYYVFFQVPEWGVYSDFPHVALTPIRSIPTPDFTHKQVETLAKTHRELIREENSFRLESWDSSPNAAKQRLIDHAVFETLNVPDDLRLIVEDFRDTRLPLDKGRSALEKLGKKPSAKELQTYGRTLRDELERFLMGEARVGVALLASPDLIRCEIKLHTNGRNSNYAVNVDTTLSYHQEAKMLRLLREQLGEKFSQWVYLDRNLRVYTDDTIQIFKAPRLMDWTRTQALNDADDVIAEIIASGEPAR